MLSWGTSQNPGWVYITVNCYLSKKKKYYREPQEKPTKGKGEKETSIFCCIMIKILSQSIMF